MLENRRERLLLQIVKDGTISEASVLEEKIVFEKQQHRTVRRRDCHCMQYKPEDFI